MKFPLTPGAHPRLGRTAAAVLWACLCASAAPPPLPAQAADRSPESAAPPEAFLEEYCVRCHGPEKQKGDLRLDGALARFDPLEDREMWLAVLEQLDTREMPPKAPLPGEEEYEEAVGWLEDRLHSLDWDKIKHPGHVTLPRLTRAEYNHTVRDLLGLDTRAGWILSPDGEGQSGFTNDRDNLFLSASELEKFFTAAELTIDSLLSLDRETVSGKLEAEDMFITESRTRAQDFPDGSRGHNLNRGQLTLYEGIHIPAPGFYRFRLRGASSSDGDAAALIRVNDQLVASIPFRGRDFAVSEQEVFLQPGDHQLAVNTRPLPRQKRDRKKKAKKEPEHPPLPDNAIEIVRVKAIENAPSFALEPAKKTGAKSDDQRQERKKLEGLVAQWNRNQVNVQRPYEWLRLHGEDGDPREHRNFVRLMQGRAKGLEPLTEELVAALGMDRAAFERAFREQNREALADRERLRAYDKESLDPDPGTVRVDWIDFSGPVMPRTSGHPGLAAAAAAALSDPGEWKAWLPGFLPRAFRSPAGPETLEKYESLYREARAEGLGHRAAARRTVSAVLVSPRFLYRAEELPADPAAGEDGSPGKGEVRALDSHQLASRLSYFLWQSSPDERLRARADSGNLVDPAALRAEVARMLADDRARTLFSTFPGQWLGYEALGASVNPDGRLFPEFTPDLAAAMKEETALLFQRIFRENRDLLELVTTEETHLNRALAHHYGIPGPTTRAMELVSLTPEQSRLRGGILGMGSVLTATSTPTRTSPVLRGVWIMERLLGDEPGAPPADAGELPGAAGKRGKTLREELEIHRDREDCSVCHDKIDPLGFGLQEFDAIGRWRKSEAGKPIDATGELPDGSTFRGVEGLREYVVERRREDFVETVAGKLLRYALGRDLQVYDEPALAEVVEATLADGSRARALVEAIVLSYPFRHQHPSPELPEEILGP